MNPVHMVTLASAQIFGAHFVKISNARDSKTSKYPQNGQKITSDGSVVPGKPLVIWTKSAPEVF